MALMIGIVDISIIRTNYKLNFLQSFREATCL